MAVPDVFIAEIGSTTTTVHALRVGITDASCAQPSGSPVVVGQGMAPTSVESGDVRIGLDRAMEQCMVACGLREVPPAPFLAASSAAGGLRMTVHGLAWDMTVRAAREAALGAGANIHLVTAGVIRADDLRNLAAIRPNIILLAGGVDHGERMTALENSRILAQLINESAAGGTPMMVPVIYGGNIDNREEVTSVFGRAGTQVICVDNVYPRIDELDVEPARRVIRALFEEHITRAPGMEHLQERVTGTVMPTPGAVMIAAQLLKEDIGDLLAVDVGGATTDVHSVTRGTEEVARLLTAPEPEAKRTVEGDLGLYRNRKTLAGLPGTDTLAQRMGCTPQRIETLLASAGPIPQTPEEMRLMEELTVDAVRTALVRHAGTRRDRYGPAGRMQTAAGKDLTAVKTVIGTGGALTRLPRGREILRKALEELPERFPAALLPPPEAEVLVDSDYTMAVLGVLSQEHRVPALRLLRRSLGLEER